MREPHSSSSGSKSFKCQLFCLAFCVEDKIVWRQSCSLWLSLKIYFSLFFIFFSLSFVGLLFPRWSFAADLICFSFAHRQGAFCFIIFWPSLFICHFVVFIFVLFRGIVWPLKRVNFSSAWIYFSVFISFSLSLSPLNHIFNLITFSSTAAAAYSVYFGYSGSSRSESSLLFSSIFCLIWFALHHPLWLNCRFNVCVAKLRGKREQVCRISLTNVKRQNVYVCLKSVFCCRLVSLHFAVCSSANLIKRQNGFGTGERGKDRKSAFSRVRIPTFVLLSCLMSFKFKDSLTLSWVGNG